MGFLHMIAHREMGFNASWGKQITSPSTSAEPAARCNVPKRVVPWWLLLAAILVVRETLVPLSGVVV
jgi:hypothetical protein